MSRKPPPWGTPYDPDDYIDVDYSCSPFSQQIRAFYASRPPYTEPSSDTDTDTEDGDGGLPTPRSLSPQASPTTEGLFSIDSSLYPTTASRNIVSRTSSLAVIPQSRSALCQTAGWTVLEAPRRMTRSCRAVALVSFSYDSPTAIETQSRENIVHITPDDVLDHMVCFWKTPFRGDGGKLC